MPELCHRCHAELPAPSADADPALFCPHCSAPQLRLPDSLLPTSGLPAAPAPPPPPGKASPAHGIDWRSALPTAAWVALVGAALSVFGLRFAFVASLSPLWVLAGGAVVLAAYLRRRPDALVDARTGWRIGVVTGLLLVGAKGVALSATGVTARFGTHSMAGYDAQAARGAEAGEELSLNMLGPSARDDKAILAQYRGLVASPEMRAGSILVFGGVQALVIVLCAGLGGGLSGTLEMRRRTAAER